MAQSNHKFTFRWPVKQVGENAVEMIVPRGVDGEPILNEQFCRDNSLSESETLKAEDAVIRAIAIT